MLHILSKLIAAITALSLITCLPSLADSPHGTAKTNSGNEKSAKVFVVVLFLVSLFVGQLFFKNISSHQNIYSEVESTRPQQDWMCQNHQQFYRECQQQLLASNTIPPGPSYVIAEQDARGLRLKTIVSK